MFVMQIQNDAAVPGSSQRFLDKSLSLSTDCIVYDLEDSVTRHKKVEARALVREALDQPAPLGIRERAVRINSVNSGLALGDLTVVVRTMPRVSVAKSFNSQRSSNLQICPASSFPK
jgi:citrate lyase beta subunit